MITKLTTFLFKKRHYLRLFIRSVVYCAAFFLIFTAVWINQNFGEPSLEQILYHLQFGMNGLVDTDAGILRSFVRTCVYWPIGIALSLAFIELVLGYFLVYRLKTHAVQRSNC
jgi:phosphoglycerol transferase